MKEQIHEAVEVAVEEMFEKFGKDADLLDITVTLRFEFKKNPESTESA